METNVRVLPAGIGALMNERRERERKWEEEQAARLPPRICCICNADEKEAETEFICVGTANNPHAVICSTACMLQLLEKDDVELDWSPYDKVNYGTRYECDVCGDPKASGDSLFRVQDHVPGPEHPPAERYLTMIGQYYSPVYDAGNEDGFVTAFCSRACAVIYFKDPENQYDAKVKSR